MAGTMLNNLTLVQLEPDREALARWAARHAPFARQRLDVTDDGYVWHGLLKAGFGASSPRPFVDRSPMRSNLLLGYVDSGASNITKPEGIDPLASQALGLEGIRATQMPATWTNGQQLSFEVRVRPIVRTRQGVRSGRVDEIDAAVKAQQLDPEIDREQAYLEWLRRELARGGAATLQSMRMSLFRRTRVVRRNQDASRAPAVIEGPDAWLCGGLTIDDANAFAELLRRGVGRHRSFGFGCLLVARPGVLN